MVCEQCQVVGLNWHRTGASITSPIGLVIEYECLNPDSFMAKFGYVFSHPSQDYVCSRVKDALIAAYVEYTLLGVVTIELEYEEL